MKRVFLILTLISTAAVLWADVSINEIRGKVELMLPGSASWIRAEEGSDIPAETRISTGFNSSAVLIVNDATRVDLKALTRIRLEEAVARNDGSQNTSLFLSNGRIRADVKKKEQSFHDFQVRSPVATAAVRGTVFNMTPRKLSVQEGSVRFSSGGYSFVILRGQEASITIIGGAQGIQSPAEEALSNRQVNSSVSDFVHDSREAGVSNPYGDLLIELK